MCLYPTGWPQSDHHQYQARPCEPVKLPIVRECCRIARTVGDEIPENQVNSLAVSAGGDEKEQTLNQRLA